MVTVPTANKKSLQSHPKKSEEVVVVRFENGKKAMSRTGTLTCIYHTHKHACTYTHKHTHTLIHIYIDITVIFCYFFWHLFAFPLFLFGPSPIRLFLLFYSAINKDAGL